MRGEVETTLDAVADGVLLVDESGRIAEVNRGAATLLGCPRREILGRSIETIVPGLIEPLDGREGEGAALRAGSRKEVLVHRLDGTPISLEVAVEEAHEGGRSFFVALLHDLSERQQHERYAHQQRERLAAAMLVSTLGEAAAAIVHEVNQPLAAIANYAQACRHIVEKDPSRTDSVLQILEKIAGQAQRAGEELRRFRRLTDQRSTTDEPRPLETIDLNDLLQEAVELAALEAAGDQPSFRLDLDPDLPPAEGHRAELEALVLGLLRIVIGADGAKQESPAAVRTRHSHDEIVLTLTAGGGARGAGEEPAGPVSPFFTTSQGLISMGAAATRSILATHRGELSVGRDEGGRTVYRIILPVRSP